MKYIISILLIVSVSLVMGQRFYSTDTDNLGGAGGFGVKGGLNIANFDGKDVDSDFQKSYGFVLGFFYEHPLSQNASLQWEVLYTKKGSAVDYYYYESYSDYSWEESGEYTFNLHYLEIPVLFKFNIPTHSNVIPAFYGGGSLGFNASAKLDYDIEWYEEAYDSYYGWEYNSGSDSGSENIDEGISGFEANFIFGGGLKIGLQTGGSFLIDARYTMGLSSVFDEESIDVKNTVWTLSLGYGF